MSGLDQALGDAQSLFERGGYVMVPLAVLAVLLWYGLGYRLVTLRRGIGWPARKLVEHYLRGETRRRPRGIVDTAAARAAELARRRPPHLRDHLDDQLGDLRDDLGRFSMLVKSVVVVAPLTGLLGTVSGMIETFEALGDMSLFSQSGGIAGGISEALITTQMGLAVAIPGLVVGRLLLRRQRLLEMEVDRVMDLVCASAAQGDME